jgi:hypothetical protein
MKTLKTAPKPVLQKLVLTLIVGIICFLIGFAFWLYSHDRTAFALSATVLVASVVRAVVLYGTI